MFRYKANCQPGYFCVDGNTMVAGCTVAFFAHIILHTLALKFVVPIFGLQGTCSGRVWQWVRICSKARLVGWW